MSNHESPGLVGGECPDVTVSEKESYLESGWECAELIASMLDGKDKHYALKMISQQKAAALVNNH